MLMLRSCFFLCSVRRVKDISRSARADELAINIDDKGNVDWHAVLQRASERDKSDGVYSLVEVIAGEEPHADGIPHVILIAVSQ
jgi:hypothetical protein